MLGQMCCFNCLTETNFSTTKPKLDKVLAGLLAQGSGKTCCQCCSEIWLLESQAVENWSGRPAQRGMHGQSSSVPQCQCQDSPVPVASQCRSSVPADFRVRDGCPGWGEDVQGDSIHWAWATPLSVGLLGISVYMFWSMHLLTRLLGPPTL